MVENNETCVPDGMHRLLIGALTSRKQELTPATKLALEQWSRRDTAPWTKKQRIKLRPSLSGSCYVHRFGRTLPRWLFRPCTESRCKDALLHYLRSKQDDCNGSCWSLSSMASSEPYSPLPPPLLAPAYSCSSLRLPLKQPQPIHLLELMARLNRGTAEQASYSTTASSGYHSFAPYANLQPLSRSYSGTWGGSAYVNMVKAAAPPLTTQHLIGPNSAPEDDKFALVSMGRVATTKPDSPIVEEISNYAQVDLRPCPSTKVDAEVCLVLMADEVDGMKGIDASGSTLTSYRVPHRPQDESSSHSTLTDTPVTISTRRHSQSMSAVRQHGLGRPELDYVELMHHKRRGTKGHSSRSSTCSSLLSDHTAREALDLSKIDGVPPPAQSVAYAQVDASRTKALNETMRKAQHNM
ncbi:hypothetical protein Ciccas_003760 [Cichlidogyrus casuarinus]|uniref:Uncharacterized protein n=1 Tax=Cichlidogyrus casuarinus TaxID=1844966 RepID=A0ABD2QEB9_9PLAT